MLVLPIEPFWAWRIVFVDGVGEVSVGKFLLDLRERL
jgi:hypothetical protein